MMRLIFGALLVVFISGAAAYANIVIGSKATKNMSCSNGVCAPTARTAVLNVTDLENQLSSQSVEVTTTGGGVQAGKIIVAAPVSWSNTSGLSLDAYRSIFIKATITVAGAAAVSLSTYDGALSFGRAGSVTFHNLSSALMINGTSFTLVDSIASLAGAIARDPAGTYAFASSYDASGDGTYTHPPVKAVLSGLFEGLGNTIANLTVADPKQGTNVGLFGEVRGAVRDIGLVDANVAGSDSGQSGENVGALIGLLDTGATVSGSFSTGSVSAGDGDGISLGGLIGYSMGDVKLSYSRVRVSDPTKIQSNILAGGLIGYNLGTVEQSFSQGSVQSNAAGSLGGFVGDTDGTIGNCYATGKVSGSNNEAALGGFVGASQSTIVDSYSTGLVLGGNPNETGGFAGVGSTFNNDYWDTTTSQQTNGVGDGNSSGLTGLTTEQLESGLPDGFPTDIWTQNTRVNKGFPFLRRNPP